MQNNFKTYISIILFCYNFFVYAQESKQLPNIDSVKYNNIEVDKIFVVGNQNTKEKIILRELNLESDTIINKKSLDNIIEQAYNNLQNTGLFNTVNISIINISESKIDILIKVSERWYFWPSPIFSIADRNFNDWWINQNHDLRRVEYGLEFNHYNFRGRNEKLKILAQFGYTKAFGFKYSMPYIDHAQKRGLSFFVSYSEKNNMAYKTINNKQVFFTGEHPLYKNIETEFAYIHRESYHNTHTAIIGFNYQHIDDTLISLNTNYFLSQNTLQRQFNLTYTFIRDLRDYRPYALKGFRLRFTAKKRGIGVFKDINQFELSGDYSQFYTLNYQFFVSNILGFNSMFTKQETYHNQLRMGYKQEVIRGYELYIIEGQYFMYNKTSLKKRLFSFKKTFHRLIPFPQFRTIPLEIYAKAYYDQGYMHQKNSLPENKGLNNKYLYGYGIGIDFVTFYDMVLRLEYSINHRKEHGLFISFNAIL